MSRPSLLGCFENAPGKKAHTTLTSLLHVLTPDRGWILSFSVSIFRPHAVTLQIALKVLKRWLSSDSQYPDFGHQSVANVSHLQTNIHS